VIAHLQCGDVRADRLHFTGCVRDRNNSGSHGEWRLAKEDGEIAEVESTRLHANQYLSGRWDRRGFLTSNEAIETADGFLEYVTTDVS
jgi:hypothetical protein